MKKRRKNLETVILAISLIALSGVGITYNIFTADEGEVSISVSRFIQYWQTPKKESSDEGLLSDYTYANIVSRDSIAVFADNGGLSREYELLPPIILPPER